MDTLKSVKEIILERLTSFNNSEEKQKCSEKVSEVASKLITNNFDLDEIKKMIKDIPSEEKDTIILDSILNFSIDVLLNDSYVQSIFILNNKKNENKTS